MGEAGWSLERLNIFFLSSIKGIISFEASEVTLMSITPLPTEQVSANIIIKNTISEFTSDIPQPIAGAKINLLFKQKGMNSEVNFHVDFELKNKILNTLMIKSFDIGLKKIADAFEKRAIELFKSSQD